MSVLRQAAAELAKNDPEFRQALAAEIDTNPRNPAHKRQIKLEAEDASGTIDWMTPKDVQKERWEIQGTISMTNPFSGNSEVMPYLATLDLNANKFFKILDWQSDPQLRSAMEKLIWVERNKIMDAIPKEEVATWEKLGAKDEMVARVARRYLLSHE